MDARRLLGLLAVVGCAPAPAPSPAPAMAMATAPIDAAIAPRTTPPPHDHPIMMPQRGCDPMPGLDVPVPVPADQAARCGDGALGSYTAGCWRTEGGGGCGIAPAPGPVRCLQALEACDGANLGGRTCRAEGFAGGRLACAPGCDRVDVADCAPCFARRGVACGEVAGVDHVEAAAVGDRGAALAWIERDDAGGAWRLATIRPGHVDVAAEPIVAWRAPEAAPSEVVLLWLGRAWAVLYLREGHLWQRRYAPTGLALDAAREITAGVRALAPDARDDRGARFAIVLGDPPAPPRLIAVGAGGLGGAVSIERPVVGQLGERTAMVLPIAGAGPGEGDLAEITAGGGTTSWSIFKQGREFGSSSGNGPGVDIELVAGHLTMQPDGDRFVTTWRPTRGRTWTVTHARARAAPAGLLAGHETVTALRFVDGGRTRLALARFAPPGGAPRLVTALVH